MNISNLVFIVMQNGADKPRPDILSRRLLGAFTCRNFSGCVGMAFYRPLSLHIKTIDPIKEHPSLTKPRHIKQVVLDEKKPTIHPH